ncbi:MAG TPA: ECF transporter S component [Negativicutes bacterium]|nr:ECF transporter S component [Negativicutes bacterium]
MKGKLNLLTKASVLLAIAVVFQLTKMGQYVTGTGINAVLVTAVGTCGLPWAVAIGFMTPVLAVLLGIQPAATMILVPFIIAGNILYASTFRVLNKYNALVGVVAAAAAKFLLLYTAANIIITKLPPPIKLAFSFPQLITALAGGILAITIMKALKRS